MISQLIAPSPTSQWKVGGKWMSMREKPEDLEVAGEEQFLEWVC